MNNKRQTRQKSAILEYLKSVKTHPTAEIVYSALKNKIPNLSLGTVYRNLSDFNKEGLLKEIEINNKKRFDGEVSFHGHFVCEKCGKIEDLFFKKPPKIDFLKNYSISNADLIFKGRCKKCKIDMPCKKKCSNCREAGKKKNKK